MADPVTAVSGIQGLTGEIVVPVFPNAPVPMGPATLVGNAGLMLQASPANTAPVYVGDSTVTVSTGMWLLPGSSMFIPVNDASDVYVISAVAGQTVRGMEL